MGKLEREGERGGERDSKREKEREVKVGKSKLAANWFGSPKLVLKDRNII